MRNASKLALAALLAFGLAAPAFAQEKAPIRIGAILPMSGFVASMGSLFKAGIVAGVDEVNAAGGINGSKLELVVQDDRLVPAESVLLFRKLASEGAFAVLGPVSSSSWENVAPLAPRMKLPAISFTFTFKEDVANNDWTLRISPDERTMIPEALKEFVTLHPNVKKVVVAADTKEASSAGAMKHFSKAAKDLGLTVLDEIAFQTQTTDFSPIVVKIKSLQPDAILSGGLAPTILGLLRELQSQKIELPLLNNAMIWPGGFPHVASQFGDRVYTIGFSTNETTANMKHNGYLERLNAMLANEAGVPKPANPGNSVMGYQAVKILADMMRRNGIDGTTRPDDARARLSKAFTAFTAFDDIYAIKIDKERNGYVPAHLLRLDPQAKQWRYAVPQGRP